MYTQRLSETLGYSSSISMLITLVSAHPMPTRNAPEPPVTDASNNVNKFADIVTSRRELAHNHTPTIETNK